MNFCDLQAQYAAYRDEVNGALSEILEQTSFIQGQPVKLLETELAAYVGVKHCVSCANGTDALVLALLALNVGPGDEVITSPFSFFATAEAISACGAKPVFADIEPDTYNLAPDKVEERITEQTKALLPVSIFGQPASMQELLALAERYELSVIEDGAQSFGATYQSRRSCGLSEVGCTSFYPTKPLGCYGDGGALFTDDDGIAERARVLANHGQAGRNNHTQIGMNSRLDTMQAAVLRIRLSHLDDELSNRQRVADRYTEVLKMAESPVLPQVKNDRTSAWAQYSIQVAGRDSFRAHLSSKDVPTAVYYELPIYRQKVYEHLSVDPAEFPVTENLCRKVVSLPMSSHLTPEIQEKVIEALQSYGWSKSR
jgi:UDP-2-acetamido-2-deoxy-ribo-hexuluronate aminotransferase